MVIRKIVNKKVIAFDLYLDITNNDLLFNLCTECRIHELFIEIYTVEKNETSLFQKLIQIGFDVVNIPYKNGTQDVAIRINTSELPKFLSLLSEYAFEEITVWSANERWEQHLFLKSARQKIYTESDLYICYNCQEKRAELYFNPNYDSEKIDSIINKYTLNPE